MAGRTSPGNSIQDQRSGSQLVQPTTPDTRRGDAKAGVRGTWDAIDEAIGPKDTSSPFGTALPQALKGGDVSRVAGRVYDEDSVRLERDAIDEAIGSQDTSAPFSTGLPQALDGGGVGRVAGGVDDEDGVRVEGNAVDEAVGPKDTFHPLVAARPQAL